jgi:hypothetical protein
METECSAEQFEFEGFGQRRVVAASDGGAVTSEAGGLLLRHTDRALGLIERVAACFQDNREQDQVVHTFPALVGQRIVGIALGYEDVNDHDELRHDPVLALLADRLEPKRPDCAPLAGKSTLKLAIDLTGAAAEHAATGQPARRFKELSSSTSDSWSRVRRVIGKAEYLPRAPIPASS